MNVSGVHSSKGKGTDAEPDKEGVQSIWGVVGDILGDIVVETQGGICCMGLHAVA